MTKTAKARQKGVRHAINPETHHRSYCGYIATWDTRDDVEPTCKWCRDRLNLPPLPTRTGEHR